MGFSFDSSFLHLSPQPPSAAAPWELEGFIKRGGAGAEGGGAGGRGGGEGGEGGGGAGGGQEEGGGGGGEMERSAGAVVGPSGWRFRQSPDPLHKLQDNDLMIMFRITINVVWSLNYLKDYPPSKFGQPIFFSQCHQTSNRHKFLFDHLKK